MNDNMEHINNCVAEDLTRKSIMSGLSGAGEHVNVPGTCETADTDTKVAHNGQGDFTQCVLVDGEADSQPSKLGRTNELAVFGVRLAAIATLHPLEYAKVLIQLGHEPMPPQVGKTIFGQPVRIWPNLFKYIGHIRSVDGLYGCYRGLTPRLLGSIVSLVGSKNFVNRLGLEPCKGENIDPDNYEQFVVTLKRDVALTASGLILSHPFHVISLRMMAQFVGHETTYKTVFGSVIEIYRNDGLAGFFAGLVPKLICDMSCVVLTSSVTYLVNKYYIKDKLIRQYNCGFVQYIFATMLYPLQVISTCMAVTRSGLQAGQPPKMKQYKNWVDCWIDLESRGEHKRGASLFWRSIPVPPKRESLQVKIFADIQKREF